MLFTPGTNLLARLSLIVLVLAGFGAIGVAFSLPVVDYWTHIGLIQDQPVPFSHKHHVGGLGLDCRYCHQTVETSANAGMPSSDTCMSCHSQIWTNAAMLAPVRQSLADKTPLVWNRVDDIPDYAYFDHSIHVAKGVACETCHGRVDRMPLMHKVHSMNMGWCLDCHRDPAPNLRPHDAVFAMGWQRDAATPTPAALLDAYHVHLTGLTDCTTCHR